MICKGENVREGGDFRKNIGLVFDDFLYIIETCGVVVYLFKMNIKEKAYEI